MIVPNMTHEEMYKMYKKDFVHYGAFIRDLLDRHTKLSRKMPRCEFRHIYRLHSKVSGQDYDIIIDKTRDQKDFRVSVYEPVVVGSGQTNYYYISIELQWTYIYTHHFLSRFRERMNIPCTPDKAMIEYDNRNNFSIVIYRTKESVVIATNDGIGLCVDDEEKSTRTLCTFVPYEMLKHTQREAYDTIKKALSDKETQQRIVESDNMLWKLCVFEDLRHEAEDIYKEYFKKND